MADAASRVFLKGRVRLLPDRIPRFPVYLFDIDGTLLDSAADICGAVQQVISTAGFPPARSTDFDYLKSFIGLHLNACFCEVFPDFTLEQREQLVADYRSTYLGRGHQQTRLYPGVVEGLAQLAGRKSTATTKGTPPPVTCSSSSAFSASSIPCRALTASPANPRRMSS